MWPDRVSNPGPLTYESGALPTALRGPASTKGSKDSSIRSVTWRILKYKRRHFDIVMMLVELSSVGTHACSFVVSTKRNNDYSINPVTTYNVEITSFQCCCIIRSRLTSN